MRPKRRSGVCVYIPLHPQSKFEHFDAAHEVQFYIFERAALSLQQRDASLVIFLRQRVFASGKAAPIDEPSSPLVLFPIRFCRVHIASIRSARNGGRWKA